MEKKGAQSGNLQSPSGWSWGSGGQPLSLKAWVKLLRVLKEALLFVCTLDPLLRYGELTQLV